MIYLFYGQDAFRSSKKVSEIKARYLEKNPTGSGLSIIEVEKGDKADFLPGWKKALGAKGLFFAKQLLIVKNFLLHSNAANLKDVLAYLEKEQELMADQDRVIIFWEEGLPKDKEKLFQYLLKNAKKQQFDLLSGFKLSEWIVSEAKKIDPAVSFSKTALEALASYVPDDGQRLSLEIEKLATFKDGGEISREDVEALVKSDAAANIFETVEALSGGDKARALKLFHEQLEKGEDPFYILSMYVYQYRNLLKIGEYFFAGEQNAYTVAKQAGLHPFVVQKGMAQLRKTTLEKIKATYHGLAEMDLKIKTGEWDPRLALDKFIVEC